MNQNWYEVLELGDVKGFICKIYLCGLMNENSIPNNCFIK